MSPRILTWAEIRAALDGIDVIAGMETAFEAYSAGRAVIPPVGELSFSEPPGDVHIKSGYLRDGQHYVIKIASGFYHNPRLGLPSSQGLMLLFEQQTGVLQTILLDEGRLTDIRTGAAGAVAARQLAPERVQTIGIVGSGTQARTQLDHLRQVSDCREVLGWGRDEERLERFLEFARGLGFRARRSRGLEELAGSCSLIVTTTPSEQPLLQAGWIQPGTHITAVGADTPSKRELDVAVLGRADRIVVDSLAQSQARGEVFHARRAGLVNDAEVVELGDVVAGRAPGRETAEQITVADLTGVAVQDLAIALAVSRAAAPG